MNLQDLRVGFGFDVHQLKSGHPFFLGGVRIEHSSGAFGHSDADVLLHAICDALLGAANLRDIGFHFSNTDHRWKGIESSELLKLSHEKLKEKSWTISNVDCTLCLEKPKIQGYIPEMQKKIAQVLAIDEDRISIKATTNETMGFIGREEGVVAYATALIFKS